MQERERESSVCVLAGYEEGKKRNQKDHPEVEVWPKNKLMMMTIITIIIIILIGHHQWPACATASLSLSLSLSACFSPRRVLVLTASPLSLLPSMSLSFCVYFPPSWLALVKGTNCVHDHFPFESHPHRETETEREREQQRTGAREQSQLS